MKVYVILCTVLIFSTVLRNGIFAQTVVIGHISAEVVESVSVESSSVTDFEFENHRHPGGEGDMVNIDLGEMKVRSGEGVSFNVVMKPAVLSNLEGDVFSLDTALANSAFPENRSEGNTSVRLAASSQVQQTQKSGLYEGSYTIVFAYN